MDSSPHDALKTLVGTYYSELERLGALDIVMERLIRTAILVEQVIGIHFPPKEILVEGKRKPPTLGDLVLAREDFLNTELAARLRKVVWIRNRDTHFHKDGIPDRDERKFAIENLEEVVQAHLTKLASECGFEKREWNDKRKGQQTPRFNIEDSQTAPPPEKDETEEDLNIGTTIDRPQRPSLEASDNDPHLTVSTVAEYAFCPRAGILSHEGAYSDRGEEVPSLGGLLWYEQNAIEEAYVRIVYWLCVLVVMFVAGLIILSITLLGNPVLIFVLMVGGGFWGYFAISIFRKMRILGRRRLTANLATECDPDPYSPEFQPVDWWGLLKAGFEVRRPEAAFSNDQWKLAGKPHRILQKGSMTIPLHKIRKTSGPLSSQHIVRAMALCNVVEAAEGAVCPFAIVLFEHTYMGTTVPMTVGNREQFYTALERVRAIIIESDAREQEPPEPVTGAACSGCPYGRPRPVELLEKTMRYGEPLDPFLLVGKNKKEFHCDCGDRFHWKPKHERNARLRRAE